MTNQATRTYDALVLANKILSLIEWQKIVLLTLKVDGVGAGGEGGLGGEGGGAETVGKGVL